MGAPDHDRGIWVQDIEHGSIGGELGLNAGDQILGVNGRQPQDLIEWQYAQAEECLRLHVLKADGEEILFDIEKEVDEGLGIILEPDGLDSLRCCQNHCLFCFLDQMPPGLRASLYVKDDDYRSSFLLGNFITLTNLGQDDWKRILNLRLSPLYISVHTVNPALRRLLLGNPEAGRVQEQLRDLARAGIELHLQAVLLPGVNDGRSLDETIAFAGELYPQVRSLALVPVGLTRHRRSWDGLRPFTSGEAAVLLDRVDGWQRYFGGRLGETLVHMSDEWYLQAGRPFPSSVAYGDYPQLENGVGLVRRFRDRWQQASWPLVPDSFTGLLLVTGELARPLIEEWAAVLGPATGTRVRVLPVANCFFGPHVNVAGLVTGQDLTLALASRCEPGEFVLFPSVMLDARGRQFLDGVQLDHLRRRFPRCHLEPVEDVGKVPGLLRRFMAKGAG